MMRKNRHHPEEPQSGLPKVRHPALAAALAEMETRLDPGADHPLAVAFSGGGDSVFLLIAALAYGRRHGRKILALTVDHGLNPQSADWTARALEQSARLGAQALPLVWRGEKPTSGLPEQARLARHRLLAEAARAAGARVILMGHTADDQAENAAMRADEGLSIGDLRVWSPSPVWPEGRDLFLFRPLLGLGRAALRNTLALVGERWIDDPANENQAYARARARRRLKETSTAPALAARGALDAHPLATGFEETLDGRLSVRRDRLVRLGEPEIRRFVQAAVACAGGGETPPKSAGVDTLVRDLKAGSVGLRTLGAALVRLGEDQVEFGRNSAEHRGRRREVPGLFDGRFRLSPVLKSVGDIRLARGLQARLSKPDRARLSLVPAPYRGAALVFVSKEGAVGLATLGEAVISLTGARLSAALGAVATEAQISDPDQRPRAIKAAAGAKSPTSNSTFSTLSPPAAG